MISICDQPRGARREREHFGSAGNGQEGFTGARGLFAQSVIDAKLTHLAYAPEIAGTMLRRRQAEAIIAACRKIVQGAVGMVVLCSDHDPTPVVNTGTLYN